MKRFGILFIFATTFYLFLSHLACDKHPVSFPAPPPTPTPTATPVYSVVQMTASTFSPAAITITVGNGVLWTNLDPYSHTVHPDDGYGNCQSNQFVAPGASISMVYSSPATINYHCWIHSNCVFGGPCDLSCAGPGAMTGIVVIQ